MAPLLATLARRAAAPPELPWLFFRRELDWRWRSHRQVADHLARAAAAIAQRPERTFTGLPLAGAESLSLLLATLLAGADFVPLHEAAPEVPLLIPADSKWPEIPPEGEARPIVELPAARGNIDRYQAEPLPQDAAGRLLTRGLSLGLADLERQAAAIAVTLFAGEMAGREPSNGKTIVHAGAKIAEAEALALLLATLADEKAVLALEPYPPATTESFLWCRPTHLFATSAELAELAEAWTKKTAKRSRLRKIVAVGEVDPTWSALLGVPVAGLPRK